MLVRRGGLFTVRLFNMLFRSLFGLYSRILDEHEHRVAENYRVPVREGAGLVYLLGVDICSVFERVSVTRQPFLCFESTA